jgi:hypothetical protein
MNAPELKIDCPCCKAKLVVDAETGGVLQAVPHKEAPPTLESFMKAEPGRAKDLEDKFAEARRQEDGRLAILEKKFEWAKKNKARCAEARHPVGLTRFRHAQRRRCL